MEMFMRAQYKDLDREMNQTQDEFKKGLWDDLDLITMMSYPFDSSDADFEEKYNDWLKEYPNSYAGHQARAYYYTDKVFDDLKKRKLDQLSQQELSEVRHYADLAIADDKAALKLDTKPFATYTNLLYLYGLMGEWTKGRQMLDEANKIAPRNTAARYQYMLALAKRDRPLKEFESFIDETRKAGLDKKYLRDYDNALNWRYLEEGHYEQLDATMNQVQKDYEVGKINDLELSDYFTVFTRTDSKLETLYNAWVEAYPKSYAARQVRGLYYRELAEDVRGGKYLSQTSQQELSGANNYLKLAFDDDMAALALTAKPIISITQIMAIEQLGGRHDGLDEMLKLAIKTDPKNVSARHVYMNSLQGRWGGSLEEMERYLEAVKASGMPEDHLKSMEDMIIGEKLWVAERKVDDYSAMGKLETGF
jgi:hypothetical protein